MATLKYFDTNSNTWKYLASGAKGEPGEGIPIGGQDGFILVKDGSDDFVTQWVDPVVISDKNHTTTFSVEDTVTVTHNLGKYPSVTVINSAGDQVEGDIFYTNSIQLIVSFANPFSGKIICN